MNNMTQSEMSDYILKLEADNRESRKKHELQKSKHQAKQGAINTGVGVIITQMSIANAALWWGIS